MFGNTIPTSQPHRSPLGLYNFKAPRVCLQALANDQEETVRIEVAKNAKLPSSSLKVLAKDGFEMVRRGVGNHPNTPIHCLEALAKDKVPHVRMEVAKNTKTPQTLLETLTLDKDPLVRHYAETEHKRRKEEETNTRKVTRKPGTKQEISH